MPTARGWVVAGVGGVTLGVGRAFGTMPLEQLGIALVVLVFVATAVVLLSRHDLRISRELAPARVRAGQKVAVEVTVRNSGRGAAPLILFEDELPPAVSGTARFAAQGIETGGSRTFSYSIRPPRRGLYHLGPLRMSFVDPFGLARSRSHAPRKSPVLVYPRVEPLALLRESGDRRNVVTNALGQPTIARGEDFYTLREYSEGDDLRKIHWGSTAKRGRYMIRQEETPWHNRATVLLDDRARVYDSSGAHDCFERAVEAAASLADMYHRSAYSYRLIAAHAGATGTARGAEQLNRCLDLLATILPAPQGAADETLLRLTELDSAGTAEASLVIVTGTITSEAAVATAALRRRFRQITVLSFPAHRFGSASTKSRWDGESSTVEAARLLQRSSVRVIALGPDEQLAAAWSLLSHHGQRSGGRWGQKPELV